VGAHSLGRRWDTVVGISSSIYPNNRILNETPRLARPTRKMIVINKFLKFANIHVSSENLTMTAILSKLSNSSSTFMPFL
jgi:hypothetical protein